MAQHFEVHSMDILDVSLNGQHHYDHHHMSSWMPQQVHPMQGIPTSQGPHHIEIYAPVYQPDIQSLNHVYYHEPIELTAPHQGIQSEHLEPMEEARYGSPNKSYSPPTENEESMEMDETNKNHSTPMTLKWLNDNYEIAEGVCIPRNTLYQHYRDFCEKHEFTAVNAASFGKIIRQTFPQVTTRRLGTRGQSKYHYYGIGVKEKSPYYDFVYSKAGLQSGIANKKETPKQTPVASYTPKSKMGTLLPEFPGIEDLKLPDDIPQDKLQTFIVMYRTHCQRILDTVIRANFDEVQSFLLHFWQGMPSHMTSILGAAPIVGMVAVCDTILYKAVCNVLMPHVLQALPESLMTVIKTFAKQLEEWIEAALNNLPEPLKDMKLEMSRNFSKILRLQMSLNHLCQASRSVVSSNDIMTQMLEDWQTIDRLMIIKQTRFTLNQLDMYSELDIINKFYDEFETLLTEQCQLESLIDWLDRLIDESVVKASDEAQKGSIKAKSQKFLLVWSAYGTRIVRDMTLHSAPSFGSFHLLSLMFDEYILYHLEQLCCDEAADEVMAEIKGTAKISFMSKLREKTVEVTSPVSFYSNESSNDVLPLATPVEASTSHMELLRTFTESHPTVATIDMSMMNPHNSSPSHNGRNNTSPLQQPHMQQQQFSQEHHQHQHQQPLRSHTQHHGHGTPHPLERPLELDQLDMRPQQAHTQQPTDTSYFSLHDCGGQSIEDTWRMSDAIPPPPNLSYHGSLYHTNNISPPTSQLADTSNILNYAVNSLNLPLDQPDHSMQDLTSEIRVTYDPVEAQASLTRSFQPFSDQFFGHSSSS